MAQTYRVTVTNITAAQIFTPLLIASHSSDITRFQVGQPASADLEIVAEAGGTFALSTPQSLLVSQLRRNFFCNPA